MTARGIAYGYATDRHAERQLKARRVSLAEVEEIANNCWADLDTDCNHAPGTLDPEETIKRLHRFANDVLREFGR